ncbi:MAG: hypothetical protein K2J04_06805, partial [Lachnospiraceae bacterium]|nr:hypothetical protein [Lachnospiraceae bacterium]
MKRKISKKHLFLILLICSIIGNVCLYMGKQRAEQKAGDIASELKEKQEALTEISNEITEKEELSLTPETNLPDIEQEIEEYRMHFIELYTSNAMEETEDRINIEETEIDYGDNGEPATLIKYTDSSGEKLRYQLQFYGETGRSSIDYYLCEDFILISRKNDYYSSWVLTAGYSDVLYSTIENWIVIDENIYILHSDGELEKIEKTQLEVPTPEEIETFDMEITEIKNSEE